MAPQTQTVQNASVLATSFFYYFAYGSNLLKERIHVQVKGAVYETTGLLRDHELRFYDYGERWRGAVASIEHKNNSSVWGCIWRVPNSFAEELDLQERGYDRLKVDVELTNGTQLVCRTYQYSNPLRQPKAPSPHYKRVIVSGAVEHVLPEEYIKWLKSIPHNGYTGPVNLNLEVLKDLNESRA